MPFQHGVTLRGGTTVGTTVVATVDGGGMINVLDWTTYDGNRMALGPLQASEARARTADGTIVNSVGRWAGTVQLGPVVVTAGFEVFDSHGSFELLLGKPWLRLAGLAQDFVQDVLTWADKSRPPLVITNCAARTTKKGEDAPTSAPPTPSRAACPAQPGQAPAPECSPPSAGAAAQPAAPEVDEGDEDKLRRALEEATGMSVAIYTDEPDAGETAPATAAVPTQPGPTRVRGAARREAARQRALEAAVLDDAIRRAEQQRREARERALAEWHDPAVLPAGGAPPGTEHWADVLPALFALHDALAPARAPEMSQEQRLAPERVRRVLDAVQIGNDVTPDEKAAIRALVAEYADVFTLSLDEVRLVDFIEHRIGVPPGTEGPRTAHQKPLTEPQRAWLYGALDEMERCDVVRRIPASAAKWVSAITLAPKDKGADGLSLDDLRRRANEECVKAGMPPMWEEVAAATEDTSKAANFGRGDAGTSKTTTPPAKAKWRLCHSFIGLNRVSQHASFPMGDLHSKHQRAAGHRWVCVADFMAGFNAIPVAQDDIVYTAFAVPGRGLYVTPRMCFGLTGAPNTFGEMVATALDGLSGEIVEPWVDDCALWGDEFRELMGKLRTFFQRCREKRLSLSATKTLLFQTEATFAGARISAAGVAPKLAKVAAILDWPEPTNAHEVLGFTSLVGHFRPLIKDYARIAKPLTDLTRDVRPDVPKGTKPRKGALKRALQREDVRWRWGREEKEAFMRLKTILTTDPVLKPPQYDRPFIVTTDGSKVGFGATLTQRWKVKDASGNIVEREFPVEYASKRTSRTEERYTPYVLEFAALKFALDKFDRTIFGQPIELVTDCRALRDTLNSEELSATHTRWMEAVIARQIIDVRHRPGVDNHTDGLSRMWRSHPDRDVNGGDTTVEPDWEARDPVPDVHTLARETADDDALCARFAGDAYFADIVEWLARLRAAPERSAAQARRARLRAREYIVQDGKLWRVGGRGAHRAPKVECVTRAEGQRLAADCHAHGHWGRDLCVESLRTRYFWPDMRRDVVAAIQDCSPCKAFGSRHMLSLLEPLTRSRPFQMLTADYLSLPKGKGGFRTVLLIVDVFTRHVWGYKSTKKAGSGKYTVASLADVCNRARKPELFGTDGGRHFDCAEVRNFCAEHGFEYTKTPPYSPWANGLVEECNKLLLGRLRRYCTPDFSADETGQTLDEMARATPANWPDFFDRAIADINARVLPSLGYSPKELLFGVADADGMPVAHGPADPDTAQQHMDDADVLRADAHARTMEHADARKARFDGGVKDAAFAIGDVVQVYQDRLDSTFEVSAKLAAKWSGPMRIVERYLGSWKVRDLEAQDGGLYVSGRRLRRWVPTRGTELARAVGADAGVSETVVRKVRPEGHSTGGAPVAEDQSTIGHH